MALVKIPSELRTLRERAEVTAFLATHGIEYETWTAAHEVAPDAPAEAILAAYGREIALEAAHRAAAASPRGPHATLQPRADRGPLTSTNNVTSTANPRRRNLARWLRSAPRLEPEWCDRSCITAPFRCREGEECSTRKRASQL